MIPGTEGESGEQVLATISGMLKAPDALLRISSGDLLGLIDKKHLETVFKKIQGERPGLVDSLMVAMQGMSGPVAKQPGLGGALDIMPSAQTIAMVLGHFKIAREQAKHDNRARTLRDVLNRFSIMRPILTLTDREQALLRGSAAMYADGGMALLDWYRFYVLMTWAGGTAQTNIPKDARSNPNAVQAEDVLKMLIGTTLPNHDQFIAESASALSRYQARSDVLARLLSECLNPGAQWFTAHDLPTSEVFDAAPRPQCQRHIESDPC